MQINNTIVRTVRTSGKMNWTPDIVSCIACSCYGFSGVKNLSCVPRKFRKEVRLKRDQKRRLRVSVHEDVMHRAGNASYPGRPRPAYANGDVRGTRDRKNFLYFAD